MNEILERLKGLRVGDVMQGEVVRLSAHQTMEEAGATLTKREVSGAPVVDELGHCVGMLTAVDFVRREGTLGTNADRCRCGMETLELVPGAGDESFHVHQVARDRVECHMSTGVQSIRADASLIDAARVMCAGHLHRLPVIDDRGHPVGLIASLDLVAAMVKASDESA